jgi:hypothetical protein
MPASAFAAPAPAEPLRSFCGSAGAVARAVAPAACGRCGRRWPVLVVRPRRREPRPVVNATADQPPKPAHDGFAGDGPGVGEGGSGGDEAAADEGQPQVDWTKRRDPAVEYADWDPETREEMIELDRAAEQWIGTNVHRMYAYESLKAHRAQLQNRVKEQDKSLQEDLAQLRGGLADLDALLGTGLVDSATDEISPAGWGVVGLSLATNVALIVAAVYFLSNASRAAFEYPPSLF